VLIPALVALLVLCAGGWIWQTVRIEGLHVWPIKITGLRTERDQWRSAEHDWRRAATIMRGGYDAVHGALRLQNAAVLRLKAEGDTRQSTGKAAMSAHEPRNADREAKAKVIDNALTPADDACRTPAAVMAAKGEL